MNPEFLREIWEKAKLQLPPLHKTEEGSTTVHHHGEPYQVDFEWWGPGCIYDAIRRRVIKYKGGAERFLDDYDYMSPQDRERLFRQEQARRIRAGIYQAHQVVGYGWEHPEEGSEEVFPGNDYTSIGYTITHPSLTPSPIRQPGK